MQDIQMYTLYISKLKMFISILCVFVCIRMEEREEEGKQKKRGKGGQNIEGYLAGRKNKTKQNNKATHHKQSINQTVTIITSAIITIVTYHNQSIYLQVFHRVPVVLKEDDRVGSSQIEAQPSYVCSQQQHIYRWVRVEPKQLTDTTYNTI